MVKADCFRFRVVRTRLIPDFAALHLTATATGASSSLSTGATRQRTNLQTTAARSIVIPPIKDQLEIVDHIKKESGSLRLAENNAQREIFLLREYRTRLIADVVTGKLDVREAAAQLPEEVEKQEPLDEADALDEGDEEVEEVDLDAALEEAPA